MSQSGSDPEKRLLKAASCAGRWSNRHYRGADVRSCQAKFTAFSKGHHMVLHHAEQHDSQWAAIRSIAEMSGCAAETLRNWVRQAERDAGRPPELTTDERRRLKDLERENFELRRVIGVSDQMESLAGFCSTGSPPVGTFMSR
jgi:transposase